MLYLTSGVDSGAASHSGAAFQDSTGYRITKDWVVYQLQWEIDCARILYAKKPIYGLFPLVVTARG